MPSCVGLVYFKSSWIKIIGSRLYYELLQGEKKSIETGILLIKMGITHFALADLEIFIV